MLADTTWLWVLFHGVVFALLALDLGVFHREPHRIDWKEAAIWSGVWIFLALAFNVFVHFSMGPDAALDFITGYAIEKSLSMDNVFVFALIFSYFNVPQHVQHRVLFWGVIGALVMRAAFIGIGAALIAKFHWVFYVFGAFLVFTAARMLRPKDQVNFRPDRSILVRIVTYWLPMTDEYEGEKFFTRKGGVLYATPLFLVLLVIEVSDLIFAVDSIPAIFAITTDTFIIYTSNVFAILGLRSLYFLLVNVIDRFVYLNQGLAVILAFVGVKLVINDFFAVPTGVSLGFIVVVIGASIILSLWTSHRQRSAVVSDPEKP